MPYDFSQKSSFNPKDFLESLMREMGFEKRDSKSDQLRQMIEKQMMEVVLNAAALALEPDVIQEVMQIYANETDPVWLIRKLIENSPETQIQILDALDEFYDQTLLAYQTLCHPNP